MSGVVKIRNGGAWRTHSGAVGTAAPPTAPRAVGAVPGNGEVAISWLPPLSNGGSPITGYTITRYPGGTTTSAAAGATSVLVPGLTNGNPYRFDVRAINSVNAGSRSAVTAPVVPNDPPSVTFGPDGSHKPPGCPAYSTAATHTASSLAGLHAALATCSGGEVIELTANVFDAGDTVVVLNDVAALRTIGPQKVLIRPPLGSRGRVGKVEVRSQNVVLGGFDVASSVRIGTNYPVTPYTVGGTQSGEGDGSWLWRNVSLNASVSYLLTGSSGAGLCEVVQAQHRFSGGDLVDIFAVKRNIAGVTLDGCYFGRVVRTYNSATPLLATLVFPGPVVAGQSQSATNETGAAYTLSSVVGTFGQSPVGSPVTVDIKVNGTTVRSLSTAATVYNDLLKIEMGSGKPTAELVINSGDTVSVHITGVGSDVPGSDLALTLGRTSASHADTVQTEVISGPVTISGEILFANSVIPASSNAALQAAGYANSHVHFNHVWTGTGDPTGFKNLDAGTTLINNRAVTIEGSYFAGGMRVYSGYVVKNNKAIGVNSVSESGAPAAVVDGTNVIDPNLDRTPPPLGHLGVGGAWGTDCPFIGDPFGANP